MKCLRFFVLFTNLFPLPFQDLVQPGFVEVQKLNQENDQLSQCTAETAVSTAAHLDLIEGETYREIKEDKQQDAVEEVPREQEIVAELQIKEEDKKEEDERLKREETLWSSEESQLAALNSSGQTDERYVLDILFSK